MRQVLKIFFSFGSKHIKGRGKGQLPTLFKPIEKGQPQKELAEAKQFRESLRLGLTKENVQKSAVLHSQKPQDLYKQIDCSFERFFQKRPYDLKSFNFWISVLGQQRKLEDLDVALKRMEELNIIPIAVTYIYLIQGYGRCFQVQKAEKHYDIAEAKFGISIQLLNSLLFVYTRNKRPELAEKVFKQIKDTGMVPDVISYTTLINAHYKTKNLTRCWDLFMEVRMGQTASPPDENLFGLMIEICSHTHDAEKAMGLYNMMDFLEYTETTYIFNAYIKALGSRRDYGAKAIEIFQQMLIKSVAIDSDTIVNTLKACSMIGDVKTAFDVLQLMKERNIPNNQYIQNMVIKVYAGACKLSYLADTTKDIYINDAWKVLNTSKENGWVTTYTLDSMCLLMANADRLPELDGLVLPLYEQYGFNKTEQTYETIIKLMFQEQRLADVFRLLKLVQEKDLKLTFNMVCFYIEAAMQAADEDKILDALQWFQKIDRQPKPSYLQILGEQENLPIRIHALLDEFKIKFGIVRDKTFRVQKQDKYMSM